MDPAFSLPGEAPTQFERDLLAGVEVGTPTTGQQLWLLLAKRIGVDQLMAVLDEFGDTHVWVPSRGALLLSVWTPVRDREIARLQAQEGLSQRAIARRMGVSQRTVLRALQGGACRDGGASVTRGIRGR